MTDDIVFGVSDFVAVFNQTVSYAYPQVIVQGELANFRVSKNRWVYFDLKDETASVKFFGSVYQLPGPLEDGLMVQVSGQPRLHPQYGFSITVQAIRPVGEGSLKRASALLQAKLEKEGLFDASRKRTLPYPPRRVGLITSGESAAYHDFTKILNERWGGVEVLLADVQVQGELAPAQIIAALEHFNTHEDPVDVLVLTRGGGSAEDLAAFSTEVVTRAIAASRIPTLVAIGHEVDLSLAELAADQRASTPSNAAQMLSPDKRHVLEQLRITQATLGTHLQRSVSNAQARATGAVQELTQSITHRLQEERHSLILRKQIVAAFSPRAALERGYAIVRKQGKMIRSTKHVRKADVLHLQLSDGEIQVEVS